MSVRRKCGGTGYFAIAGAADSGEYPATGERPTTLRRGRYFIAAAPATPPAAPAAAARPNPPGMNGKPNPAPRSLPANGTAGIRNGADPNSPAGAVAASPSSVAPTAPRPRPLDRARQTAQAWKTAKAPAEP